MATKAKFPFGPASTEALTAAGTDAIIIENNKTIIDGVTVEATGARTLNLTIDESVDVGAEILVKFRSATGVTDTITFGAGMEAQAIAHVADKTLVAYFTYDGTNFVQSGLQVQVTA